MTKPSDERSNAAEGVAGVTLDVERSAVDDALENLARILEGRGITRTDPHVNRAVNRLRAALSPTPEAAPCRYCKDKPARAEGEGSHLACLMCHRPLGPTPEAAPDGLREALRAAIGEAEAGVGLTHWHHASGGTMPNAAENDRAGVFVDRQQVLDAIDRVLR